MIRVSVIFIVILLLYFGSPGAEAEPPERTIRATWPAAVAQRDRDEFIIHSEMLQDQRISRINNLLAYSFLLGISRVVNVVLSERETHLASGRVAF